MNHDAAARMATRVINTWRGGAPLTDWVRELVPLDEGRAGTAFARLKARRPDGALSIADFAAEYARTDAGDAEPPPCAACGDTGWVETEDHVNEAQAVYSGVRPCSCPRGQQVERAAVWQQGRRRNFIDPDSRAEALENERARTERLTPRRRRR